MALSVSRGQNFIVLFIAIVFHRKSSPFSSTSDLASSATQSTQSIRSCVRLARRSRGSIEVPPHPTLGICMICWGRRSTIRTTLDSPFTLLIPPLTRPTETFEGLGLGTRIALLKFSRSNVCGVPVPRTAKPLLMAFAYGITTPIGQAIGLALLFSPGTSYDPASRSALILVGTMNGLSAGLLLWASLVELLAAGTHPPYPLRLRARACVRELTRRHASGGRVSPLQTSSAKNGRSASWAKALGGGSART